MEQLFPFMHSVCQLVYPILNENSGAGPFVVGVAESLFFLHKIFKGLL